MAKGQKAQKKQKVDKRRVLFGLLAVIMALLMLLPMLTMIIGGAGAVTQSEIDALKQEQAESQARQKELKEQLEHALADKSIGIILLTEKFGREFPEIIDNVKLERKLPLIVEIPDRHGTGRKPDFITSYVNEAIGLKL